MSNYGFSIPTGGYDGEDRLVSFNRTSGLSQSWNLSAVGDWNSVTTSRMGSQPVTKSPTHGPTHELLTGGGQNVSADVKGNITQIPASLRPNSSSLTSVWDFDNRLASATTGSTTVSQQYDALGRRVARTSASSTTIYVQAGQQTIADYVSGAAPASSTYRYVYASYIDEPVMRWSTSNSTAVYYHRNQQYSVTALTDASGAVLERYAYTAYGVPTITNASGGVLGSSAQNNRYTYTGREWDKHIQQYHYRARMYDPALGRFCSRDPIGYSTRALNRYEYVSAQSTREIDPSGKVKIFNVDNSPKCSFDDEDDVVIGNLNEEPIYSPGKKAGAYWGIMVELSPSEKDDLLADNGGFLVFTVRSRMWKWDCPNVLVDQSDKTNWAATAIIVLDGEVKMHHTNDPEMNRQYLSIFDMNGVQLEGKCGSGKLRFYFNVTVEVLNKTQARQLLHINRFNGESPTGDEVGRWTMTRPWRAGGDRSKIPRTSATADFLFNKCVDPAVCNAQGAGASGSASRSKLSYYPREFPDPWRL